ncbi:MAG: biosynthetic-type acetolactate synthase large subunit [bacterium]|nr:biosynthetic-type acetolactate synthase large subunit [bacterium]
MEKISGAQALMKSLLREGVDTIFGYPGGAIMPVYDALYDYKDSIRHVLVRHEQGAAHAAEGYSRLSGKPGVCMVTSGPGATNLVTGIADAMSDSIPIVCITGQVTAAALGTDAFQEAPVIGIVTPVTKWCYQITNAAEIPHIVAKAFHIASSGRKGPVLIDITKDAQFELCEYDDSIQTITLKSRHDPHFAKKLDRAAALLNSAKRPYVLFGHGISLSKAENELVQFVEQGGFPAASTLLGLSSMPKSHPLYMGMLGMHGNYAPNKLTNKADVIFAIGMRFDDRVTGDIKKYAPQAKIIHVDIDHAELDKVITADIAIHADAKEFLAQITPLIKSRKHDEWIGQFKKLDTEEREVVVDAELYPKSGEISMAEVVRIVSEKTKGKAVIVADVGQHQMVSARYYGFENSDSFITSGGLGTMGFALPASIGAKIAGPKREVIAIIGDGSFQMNIQELGTIMQEKLSVKIIILNNRHLGMVRQWQELFFEERYSFVHMENPNFNKIADGYSIPNELVEERKDLAPALDRMLKAEGSYLLDIMVKRDENVFPMIPSGAAVDEVRLK